MDQHPLPPAGWYVDPSGSAQYRFWDGSGWTAHVQGWSPPTSIPAGEAVQPHTSVVTPVRSGRAKWLLPLLMGGFAVLVLAAGAGIALRVLPSSDQHALRGSVTLTDVYLGKLGSTCGGEEGLTGSPITFSDEGGNTVGRAGLQSGRVVKIPDVDYEPGMDAGNCEFAFEATVDDANLYVVELPNHGQQTFRKSELESAGWRLELVLGE